MSDFREKNIQIDATMRTHLIDDLDSFGIWDDDYSTFCKKRAIAISNFLKKRIIRQDVDEQEKQVSSIDDVEETEIE
ncbi:MAG: hypothetical protein GY765_24990 [bacterium]|nr:hypothetical protein [bacterium]